MEKRKFLAKDGRTYEIQIDDFGEEITVYHEEERMGSITLRCFDSDPPVQPDESFHLMNLSLDKCQRLGIGEAALRFHIELHGGVITATANDGIRREDGSHLTGAGPGFVTAMQRKGLVAYDGGDHFEPDDDC